MGVGRDAAARGARRGGGRAQVPVLPVGVRRPQPRERRPRRRGVGRRLPGRPRCGAGGRRHGAAVHRDGIHVPVRRRGAAVARAVDRRRSAHRRRRRRRHRRHARAGASGGGAPPHRRDGAPAPGARRRLPRSRHVGPRRRERARSGRGRGDGRRRRARRARRLPLRAGRRRQHRHRGPRLRPAPGVGDPASFAELVRLGEEVTGTLAEPDRARSQAGARSGAHAFDWVVDA